jgi:crotonobetainyl-CoA:carnitine CoA-transferase CaiB-like acyl-CoA transferase
VTPGETALSLPALPGDALMHEALAGLRVIDLTQLLPGPFATMRLAQWGAEVIKIEPPSGDPTRRFWRSAREHRNGEPGPLFRVLNGGKELFAVNLRDAVGRAELLELISSASLLVEGFRPGVMARLGLDRATLAQANPRLVHCAITGYGQTGPWAGRAGHDLNYLAMSGVLDQVATAGGEMAIPNLQVADLLGGAQAALSAMLAALWSAQRHGRGRFIDISMTHELLRHHVTARASLAVAGQVPPRGGDLLSGGAPCYGIYATAEGRHLVVAALEHKFWAALCHVLGRPQWADQHWSRGQMPGSEEAGHLREELAALFASRSSAQWLGIFDAIDCCVTPVLRLDEALAHPLFSAR